jgi:lysozyme family protein
MNRIDAIIGRVIARESALFTNNPNDSGRATKYGITQDSLSRFLGRPATVAEVQALTEAQAREFYFWQMVHEPEFDAIVAIDEFVGAELIDTGTLCGPARAATFLQVCLNALNQQGKVYADIHEDGDAGPATRAALRAYIAQFKSDGVQVLIAAMNCELGHFLIDLSRRRPKDEEFVRGWLANRVLAAA